MKKLLFILSFLFASGFNSYSQDTISHITSTCLGTMKSSATPACPEGIYFVYSNDSLEIYGTIEANCCGDHFLKVQKLSGTILIESVDTGNLCHCLCKYCFDIKISVTALDTLVKLNGESFNVKSLINPIDTVCPGYKPIVKDDNRWSVVSAGLGAINEVCNVETNNYKFSGDTIIDAKLYKKVFSNTNTLDLDWKMEGFIREDVSLKKVWARNLKSEEGLIYDFDVSIGSEITIQNPFLYGRIETYKITEIDTILIESQYRKRYALSTGFPNDIWIEGIGSKYGILNCNVGELSGGFRALLCFSDNAISYENPKFQTCFKTAFTPKITNLTIDKGYVNKEYAFQITTTEIFEADSVIYFISGSWLPEGLKLDMKTGLISGVPTVTGTSHLFICVNNNGYVTNYLETDLIVALNSDIEKNNAVPAFILRLDYAKRLLLVECRDISTDYIVSISDLSGRKLSSKVGRQSSYELDISELSDGIYIVTVADKNLNRTIFSDKLLINR